MTTIDLAMNKMLNILKNKFDAIGISAVVSTAYAYTKYLSTLIRKLYPETIIFMGGGPLQVLK